MKNKIYYLLAFAGLIAVAAFLYKYVYLKTGNAPVPISPGSAKSPAISNQADCEKNIGVWEKGIAGGPLCVMPAADAGKICSDQSDCQGDCVVDLSEEQERQVAKQGFLETSGRCSDKNIVRGCGYYVEQGKAVAACKD